MIYRNHNFKRNVKEYNRQRDLSRFLSKMGALEYKIDNLAEAVRMEFKNQKDERSTNKALTKVLFLFPFFN